MVSSLRSGALPLRLDDGPSVGKQTNSKRMRQKDDKVPRPGNDKRQELSKVPEIQEEEDEEPFEDNHRKGKPVKVVEQMAQSSGRTGFMKYNMDMEQTVCIGVIIIWRERSV
ncbi:hypothetical protein WJX77_008070 [Trebouxia sp. C0004]